MEQNVKNSSARSTWILALICLMTLGSVFLVRMHQDRVRTQAKIAAEKQFIADMTAHELEAVALARVAEERGSAPEIKSLARSIQDRRRERLSQLKAMSKKWYGAEPEMEAGTSGFRGPSSGTHLQAISRLQTADDFDRTFLAVMVPHNGQAVFMAGRAEGEMLHREARYLALEVTARQQQELELMQTYVRSGFPSTFTQVAD